MLADDHREPTPGPSRRLLALVSKPQGLSPGQRFRLEQWAPRLKRDHGITLDFVPFESSPLTAILYKPGLRLKKALWVSFDFFRRAGTLVRVRRYDAVVVYREAALLGPAIYERLIAWSGKPIIYDFDDSIWSGAQQMNNGVFSKLHFFGKTSAICRLAAAVTPGNSFLAAYARKRNPNTVIIPTSIELDDYPLIEEPALGTPFTVCWTGSTSTLAHFEHARPALEELARRLPLVVKIICNQPPERPIAGATMRFVAWSQEREAEEVGDCHAGIMPLPDDDATRGKCGLKALQCMATGRPVVVSAVGMNTDLIEDGINGFLAADTAEFVDRLYRLSQSATLRRQMGMAGRRAVELSYSAEAVAARFARVVRQVTG